MTRTRIIRTLTSLTFLVAAVTAAGVLYLAISQAAGKAVVIEPEAGSHTATSVCTDDQASGDSFVRFSPSCTDSTGGLERPVQILHIGDSLTQSRDGLGHPYQLQTILDNNGCTRSVDYAYTGTEGDHEGGFYANYHGGNWETRRMGYGGHTTAAWLHRATNVVTTAELGQPADVAHILIGVNNHDGWAYQSYPGVPRVIGDGNASLARDDVRKIIEFIRTQNPHVFIVIAPIEVGWQGDQFNAALNPLYAALADEMNTADSTVVMAQSAGLGSGDFNDGVHPTEGGAKKIAQSFYNEIKSLMQPICEGS